MFVPLSLLDLCAHRSKSKNHSLWKGPQVVSSPDSTVGPNASQGFIQNLQGWRLPVWASCYNDCFPEEKLISYPIWNVFLQFRPLSPCTTMKSLVTSPWWSPCRTWGGCGLLQPCLKDTCSSSFSAWSSHSRCKPPWWLLLNSMKFISPFCTGIP